MLFKIFHQISSSRFSLWISTQSSRTRQIEICQNVVFTLVLQYYPTVVFLYDDVVVHSLHKICLSTPSLEICISDCQSTNVKMTTCKLHYEMKLILLGLKNAKSYVIYIFKHPRVAETHFQIFLKAFLVRRFQVSE